MNVLDSLVGGDRWIGEPSISFDFRYFAWSLGDDQKKGY